MRQILLTIAVLVVVLFAAPVDAQESPSLKTDSDKLNYALGARIGRDLRDRSLFDVNSELLFMGIRDALAGGQLLMSEQEIDATMKSLRQKLALAAQQRAEENRRKGAEFLEANKKQGGVVTLESGLQYKIVKQGDGPKPTPDDRVVVNYRGTLMDGTEFDSSYARKQPATFSLKQIIKGWREALPLMPVGSKWQLFVPSRLAYGTRGNGRQIGPNATLIFELELISIKDKGAGGVAHVAQSENATGTDSGAVKDVQPVNIAKMVVSFKLDPSLMGGSYAQPGWITPQIYQGVRGQNTVEAKVECLDPEGKRIKGIKAEWIPEDPKMVTVSAGMGTSMKILIHGPGQSTLKVVGGDITKTLSIKATSENDILRIEISQL